MIYEIDNKYYVKVGYEYNEIEIKLDKNKEVVLIPLKNRIDGKDKNIKEIIFKNEKDNFKKKLQKKESPSVEQIPNDTSDFSSRGKYSRWR